MNYPGFWRQALAVIIDQLVILIPAGLIPEAYYYAAVAHGAGVDAARSTADLMFIILALVFFAAYYLVLNGQYGVTLGRRLMNLKLIRLDQPNRDGIGWDRAVSRLFIFLVASGFIRLSVVAGIPVILAVVVDAAAGATVLWMLIDERRRTLEDMIAGTVLVHDPSGKFPNFDPDKLPPAKIRPYSFGLLVLINALGSIFTALQR
jgi:uncharacterized RDD family membrane protein YckC